MKRKPNPPLNIRYHWTVDSTLLRAMCDKANAARVKEILEDALSNVDTVVFGKELGKMPKYKISILGDSISTYLGYNPYGYSVYYKEDRLYDNELESVDDTWWKQVIDGLDGELCVNNSYSGSLVAGIVDTTGCSVERCSGLHKNSPPDVILIYMGTNDRGFEINLGMVAPNDTMGFYGAYRTMLSQIKKNYPTAKIVCGTLLMAYKKDFISDDYDRFVREDGRYNEAIRLAVKEEGCLLADIALSGERYESLDYCHPTQKGHKTMAELWLKQLIPLLN